MKKKLTLLTISIIVSLCAVAQTQQGIVKTPGRLGGNGQVIPGNRLSGATIKVKGRNTVMSNSCGEFSFPIPANKFFLDSVKLKNYVLVDPEATARQYTYSTNPLILLMEKPDQQTDILLANEQTIRNTLQEKLQAKEAEIEALKKQNKITQEEYRKAMQQLFAEQESNEKLIKEMAERYSQIDFDQMDELNQRISDCIMNGRLTEADSLLRTKGDINARIDRLNKQHEANIEVRDNLEKSEALEQKDREDIAQDCYHRHELFAMDYQNDSAAHYLELRAALDTTNIQWQLAAGNFIEEYLANYGKALEYYQRCLKQAQAQYGEDSYWSAKSYNNIGSVYNTLGEYSQALIFYKKGLDILELVLGKEHPDIAAIYNNIGFNYYNQEDFDRALEFDQKAIDIWQQTLDPEHPDFGPCFINIGLVYYKLKEYTKALEYYQKGLDILVASLGAEHINVALCYNNIGNVYSDQKEYTKALEYYQKALNIWNLVLGEGHPFTTMPYRNIGAVYANQGEYDQALDHMQKSLDFFVQTLGTKHPDVASTYFNIGAIYAKKDDYAQALEYMQQAISIWESKSIKSLGIAQSYCDIGAVYVMLHENVHALECFQKALIIREQTLGTEHPDVGSSYFDIGLMYFSLGVHDKALYYCSRACDIFTTFYGSMHPSTQEVKKTILLLKQALGYNKD